MDTTQLKISLPLSLYDYLNSKAGKFGVTLSSYVKNLIINDVKDMDFPTFQASAELEHSYRQAKKQKKQAIKVEDMGQFFDSL
jgi:hypothetical protein